MTTANLVLVNLKFFAPDPPRLRSGQALAPLVKARGFRMTLSKIRGKVDLYGRLSAVDKMGSGTNAFIQKSL
jgi:hypothetical protein